MNLSITLKNVLQVTMHHDCCDYCEFQDKDWWRGFRQLDILVRDIIVRNQICPPH